MIRIFAALILACALGYVAHTVFSPLFAIAQTIQHAVQYAGEDKAGRPVNQR